MSCPTCDHTMQSLGYTDGGTVWHCPRCGTVRHHDQFVDAPPRVYVPKLVERCRKFRQVIHCMGPAWAEEWDRLSITESINRPEART